MIEMIIIIIIIIIFLTITVSYLGTPPSQRSVGDHRVETERRSDPDAGYVSVDSTLPVVLFLLLFFFVVDGRSHGERCL